jgi:uncharacterized protein
MLFLLVQLAAATGPSFDCARARTPIERTICAHAELGALDREEARLYRIARVVPGRQREALLRRQREFLAARNNCPGSAAPLDECIRDAYLSDIGDLRRMATLEDDNEGLSRGPIRFHCNGYHDAFVTTFRTGAGQAYIAVPDLNEGQPLAADPSNPRRFVGRYATDMIYDAGARRLALGPTICTPAG